MSGCWFSSGVPVSSTNKTDRHDMTEILLKVALNTINQTKKKKINGLTLILKIIGQCDIRLIKTDLKILTQRPSKRIFSPICIVG
jgi:hypothetical protein